MTVDAPSVRSGSHTRPERLSAMAGILATVLALGGVVLATVLSPEFQWGADALSALGNPDGRVGTDQTALVFNGGLIAGGLIGLGLGYRLVQEITNVIEALGLVLLGLVAVSMMLVGVFPTPHEYHMAVSMLLFTSISVAFFVYGTGVAWRGIHSYGLGTIWLGIVNTVTWLVWLTGGAVTRGGVAIPEFIGSLVLATWTLWTAWRLLRSPPR